MRKGVRRKNVAGEVRGSASPKCSPPPVIGLDVGQGLVPFGARNVSAVATPSLVPKVFIVHGRDEAALHIAARFIERIGLEVIVMREQPDAGRAIIEKFEDCADQVSFAVVLFTPDDIGSLATASTRAARASERHLRTWIFYRQAGPRPSLPPAQRRGRNALGPLWGNIH
jgi:Predicted nucleotide-binding protein containing TIR-like domain